MADGVVTACVVAWLERDDAQFDTAAGVDGDHQAEIDRLRVLVDESERALLGRPPAHLVGVDRGKIRAAFEEDSARLAELEREQTLAVLPSPVDGVTAENFPGLPLERRRAVVDYLVDILVLPVGRGRAAGEDSIDVTPKRRRSA
jgi:hypothetical protein